MPYMFNDQYNVKKERTCNGGDTSRLGAGKVLIFKTPDANPKKAWEAHQYMITLGTNAFALGNSPEDAYNRLKSFIDTLSFNY